MTVTSPLDPAQYLRPISSPAVALVTQDPAANASALLAATPAPAHGDKALRRSAVPESAAFVRTARSSPDGRKKSPRPYLRSGAPAPRDCRRGYEPGKRQVGRSDTRVDAGTKADPREDLGRSGGRFRIGSGDSFRIGSGGRFRIGSGGRFRIGSGGRFRIGSGDSFHIGSGDSFHTGEARCRAGRRTPPSRFSLAARRVRYSRLPFCRALRPFGLSR